jgi:tRNA threonylcarbamoyladenosine biosynthesis protein TsaB
VTAAAPASELGSIDPRLAPMLAIETSQRGGGVALLANGTVRAERFAADAPHDEVLMPAIDRLVRASGTSPRELRAVAVSIGPGGFTGLRIAVTTAKMIALATGARIAAVPSALVAAGALDPATVRGSALVVLAVKRESLWASTVRAEAGRWRLAGGALVDARDVALASIAVVVADEHLPAPLRERCARAAVAVVAPSFDPVSCLRAGADLLEAGAAADPLLLEPLYARPPEAVRIWEGRAGSGRTTGG